MKRLLKKGMGPAAFFLLLALCGCATATYPEPPAMPEYPAVQKQYDTSALCHLYPTENAYFQTKVQESLKQNGYRLFEDADYLAPSPLRPDWVVVPLHVSYRTTRQADGVVLDTRVIVMIRRPGAVSGETLQTRDVRFFQAWNRARITGRGLLDTDYTEGIDGAVKNLFHIDEFRSALVPDGYYRGEFTALRQSAAAGNPEAQWKLCRIYEKGERSVAANSGQAIRWVILSARNGNPDAEKKLCEFIGGGIIADSPVRMEWLTQLADRGNADACFLLGVNYDNGKDGCASDKPAALKWYLLAAGKGHVAAMNNLGILYRDGGEGVEANPAESVKWFRKSAEAGNPLGQYNLGYACETGSGVEKSEAEALKWYAKAAAQGNSDAAFRITQIQLPKAP